MALRHAGLLAAVESDVVTRLRTAAAIINAPDPLDALKILDCDVDGIKHLTDNMANARSPIKQASYDLAKGLELATRNWEGDAMEAFLVEAGEVQADHLQAQQNVEKTANAGSGIAPALDRIAQSAADSTITTAQLVEGECILLLAGDMSPENIEKVNEACVAIVDGVARLASSISGIAPALGDLVNPVRR
jgi:hypothetical protein